MTETGAMPTAGPYKGTILTTYPPKKKGANVAAPNPFGQSPSTPAGHHHPSNNNGYDEYAASYPSSSPLIAVSGSQPMRGHGNGSKNSHGTQSNSTMGGAFVMMPNTPMSALGGGGGIFKGTPTSLRGHSPTPTNLLGGAPTAIAERFKTHLCSTFVEKGKCKYGVMCNFAHGPMELRSVDMNMTDGLTSEPAITNYRKEQRALAKRAKEMGIPFTPFVNHPIDPRLVQGMQQGGSSSRSESTCSSPIPAPMRFPPNFVRPSGSPAAMGPHANSTYDARNNTSFMEASCRSNEGLMGVDFCGPKNNNNSNNSNCSAAGERGMSPLPPRPQQHQRGPSAPYCDQMNSQRTSNSQQQSGFGAVPMRNNFHQQQMMPSPGTPTSCLPHPPLSRANSAQVLHQSHSAGNLMMGPPPASPPPPGLLGSPSRPFHAATQQRFGDPHHRTFSVQSQNNNNNNYNPNGCAFQHSDFRGHTKASSVNSCAGISIGIDPQMFSGGCGTSGESGYYQQQQHQQRQHFHQPMGSDSQHMRSDSGVLFLPEDPSGYNNNNGGGFHADAQFGASVEFSHSASNSNLPLMMRQQQQQQLRGQHQQPRLGHYVYPSTNSVTDELLRGGQQSGPHTGSTSPTVAHRVKGKHQHANTSSNEEAGTSSLSATINNLNNSTASAPAGRGATATPVMGVERDSAHNTNSTHKQRPEGIQLPADDGEGQGGRGTPFSPLGNSYGAMVTRTYSVNGSQFRHNPYGTPRRPGSPAAKYV